MRKTTTAAALTLTLVTAALAQWEDAGFPYPVPKGLEAPSVPEGNPMNDAKVELGKRLYFDKRLSVDNTVSCASCHDPKKGWTDQAAVSTGVRGQKGGRSAPTVLNSAYYEVQFWDGRAADLEEQAKGPIANPIEMGFTHEGVVERLKADKSYVESFRKAFGGDAQVTIDLVAKAIAAFERTVLTGDAPYDRMRAGDKKALTPAAQRGMALFFGKGNCSVCHSGFNFSDSDFHNIGVGMAAAKPDLGRWDVTKREEDKGKFRTPGLRNLASTFPYMHDGSQRTLEEVIEFYDKGGEKNPNLDREMRPLHLTADEKKDLIAFLGALNGDPRIIKP